MNAKIHALAVAIALSVGLTACSTQSIQEEHYVSPKVHIDSQKINLEEVQKAFWDSKGNDLASWMGSFEKRVNEIYDGQEVISIDATRKSKLLLVTGFIDKDGKEGFDAGDEKLFSIEQTGDAVNNEMPYRVNGYNDRPYYEGHHSFLGNPFLQAMLLSHAFGSFGGYYTRPTQVVVLKEHRDSYRQTPQFEQQKTANQGFFSRFKSKSSGGLESSKKFGASDFSSSSGSDKSRSWNSSSSTNASSSWGRRRSSGSSLFGSSLRRGWGGRRR